MGPRYFKKALGDLGWCHDISTPYRPHTNGVAERAARRVKEGTYCSLNHLGRAVQLWPEAMASYCFMRNIAGIQKDGLPPTSPSFSRNSKDSLCPSAQKLNTNPAYPKDLKTAQALNRIFVGYDQRASGNWSGDYLIAD